MKDIHWYLKRLTKMSFREILYRIQQKVYENADKFFFRSVPHPLPSTDSIIGAPVYSMSQHVTACHLDTFAIINNFQYIELAEKYCANVIAVFGVEHDFGPQIDWHIDVKTGKRWPLKPWSEIDIRNGFKIGGPKFVWEINRLYGLPVLGFAYRSSRQEKYARKIISTLRHWLEENPYPLGVNWTSGIELGIRVANLIWGLSFLQGYSFSREEKDTLTRFLWLHGRHLYRFPSKYSSNNNHAIAEAFGLFLIGTFFPFFHEAKKWSSFGQNVLEHESARQILPDGGSYEYSTTYLSFVIDFFLLFKLVCDRQNIAYETVVNTRLESSCEFIHSLMDCGGQIPNIGDQDSAILVNFGLNNQQNFQSLLNTGAVLFNRPEFKRDNFPDFKTQILLGDQKFPAVQTTTRRKITGIFLPDSGFSVIRDTITQRELVLVGNATPLGMPPLFAHGHLDALSFTLSYAGLEFFVDPGTYLYHSGGKWRRYFRSTAAHNTIRVNKTELTDMPGDFMFGKPYRVTKHTLSNLKGHILWQAGHDAYSNSSFPVSVNRSITVFENTGDIKITDRMESTGKYFVEQFFHFHPECAVNLIGEHVISSRNGYSIKVHFDNSPAVKLYRGSSKPLWGWYSERFNHLQKTSTIVCSFEKEGVSELTTEIQLLTQEGSDEN